jgi:hypothetical protein
MLLTQKTDEQHDDPARASDQDVLNALDAKDCFPPALIFLGLESRKTAIYFLQ